MTVKKFSIFLEVSISGTCFFKKINLAICSCCAVQNSSTPSHTEGVLVWSAIRASRNSSLDTRYFAFKTGQPLWIFRPTMGGRYGYVVELHIVEMSRPSWKNETYSGVSLQVGSPLSHLQDWQSKVIRREVVWRRGTKKVSLP